MMDTTAMANVLGLHMSVYELCSLIVAIAGVIGLIIYVVKTVEIAGATRLSTDILSHPAITAHLYEGPATLSAIGVIIENHTALHANLKIKIIFTVTDRGSPPKIILRSTVTDKAYGGEAIWNISAKDKISGHTDLPKLTDTREEDYLKYDFWVEITAKTAPYGQDKYKQNPIVRYKYKHGIKGWIPDPVLPNT